MEPSVLPYGPGALLVETAGNPAELAFALRRITGVLEAIPGAATVLVTFDGAGMSEEQASQHFSSAIALAAEAGNPVQENMPAEVLIPVRYDGEDLVQVAAQCAMSVEAVIDLHSRARYEVAFMGFAPGFGYLTGLPEVLHLPRLQTPRTAVPAGSVAIAGEYSAVYPGSSPGGWLLLGHTGITLFDEEADPPAILAPGTIVRFEAQ